MKRPGIVVMAVLAAAALASPAPAAAAPGDLGATMVADINPAPGVGSAGSRIVRLGGLLVFAADDGTSGTELWRSDGTAAGTVLVKDINPGSDQDPPDPDSSDPEGLAVVGGSVYFRADDGVAGAELWKSDGTAAGTTLVKDINPGSDEDPPYPDGSSVGAITGIGTRAFFSADDGSTGTELWTSDGTGPGTQIMNGGEGINTAIGVGSDPGGLAVLGTTLFFGADGGADGLELWKSASPYTSASQVADINPAGSSTPAFLTDYGGTLFFGADDGSSGRELWRSDGGGLGSGTELVKDINQTPASSASSNPSSLTVAGGTLFFQANDGFTGFPGEPWKSDGTGGGTALVADINPTAGVGSTPYQLAPFGSTLLFSASEPSAGAEPWKSNGLLAGTTRVADVRPGPTGSSPTFQSRYFELGGRAFFDADDGTGGRELWATDGGPLGAGTGRVADINPGPPDSNPRAFVELNGTLFFFATTASSGAELWKTYIEPEPPPSATPPPAAAPKKRCKKGRKLKKGKCVKKGRKKKRKK